MIRLPDRLSVNRRYGRPTSTTKVSDSGLIVFKVKLTQISLSPLLPYMPSDCWMCISILDLLSTEDLLSASYVCKGLHTMVKPLIFRTITWEWDKVSMQWLRCYAPFCSIMNYLGARLDIPRLASISDSCGRLSAVTNDWLWQAAVSNHLASKQYRTIVSHYHYHILPSLN